MIQLFDAHCDTIVKMRTKGELLLDNTCHVSIRRLQQFSSPVQFFALCMGNEQAKSPYKWFLEHAELYHQELENNSQLIRHANTYKDIEDNMDNGHITAVLAIEGAEVLEGSMDYLHKAYELGVRCINPTWNHDNEWGYGSEGSVKEGLTALGKSFVREMNSLGIVIDVSHLSVKGFWDVCEISEVPFIASHSNAYTITPVTRNLNDDQLRAIGQKGGVAGLNLCARFLQIDGNPAMADALRHLDKMLSLAGEDGVGLGCDFDGISDPTFELTDVSKMDLLYEECIRQFGLAVTEKIFFKNFMRAMKAILK